MARKRDKKADVIDQGIRVLKIEARSVQDLVNRVGNSFVKAVDLLLKCSGRVIVTGMGKSGLVGRKITATLASTGTPALFLHPAEGIHGDLGVLAKRDTVLAVSYSGETEEILRILPGITRIGIKIISLTGNLNSTLARHSDICLDVSIKEEACPLGLSPTASTTAALAMGDALAIALLKRRGFKSEDYAKLHPGGSLGRQLITVGEIMHKGADVPRVKEDQPMSEVIIEMTNKKMGCTSVVNKDGVLVGIITDQDLRNSMKSSSDFLDKKAGDIMTRRPKTVARKVLVSEAIRLTEEKRISTLLIVDAKQRPAGIVHLHDLLKGRP